MSFERPVVKCEVDNDSSPESTVVHRVLPKPHTIVTMESQCACGHYRNRHCQCGETCTECTECEGYNQGHVDHGEADETVP